MKKSLLSILVLLAILTALPFAGVAQHRNSPSYLSPATGGYINNPPTFSFHSNDDICYLLVVTNDSNECESNGTGSDLVHLIGFVSPGSNTTYTPTLEEWRRLRNGTIYWHVDGSAQLYSNQNGCAALPYNGVHSPCIQLTKMADPLSFCQESIPPPVDSGTRLVRTAILVTSSSAFPAQVFLALPNGPLDALQDSLFKVADSIELNYAMHDKPWQYEDSVYGGKYSAALLDFIVSPAGTIRIPLVLHSSIAHSAQQMIDSIFFQFQGVQVDTTILGYSRLNDYAGPTCYLKLPAACVAPFDFGDSVFGSTLYSNKHSPVYLGGSSWSANGHAPTQGYYLYDTTRVTFQFVGDYSDRFHLSWRDTTLTHLNSSYISLPGWTFTGAPKSVVHDTLITTSTDCYGSVVTRTPIDGYSIYRSGYNIHQLPGVKAPFLGSAQGNAAVVINTSDFPITLRNLQASGYDSVDFDVSAPAMIAAHDSGYISVRLTDRNVYRDTLFPERSTNITGIVAPYQQDIDFVDSAFTFFVLDTIDVYSPEYYGYYASPTLKRGIHQTGIIFTSSVSSTQAGPGTFITVYANHNPTTEYFGMPYYDDPHFSLSITNYTGFGVSLPGYVSPDTGFLTPIIEVQTNFTGDRYHNYRTQLHWPIQNDTVSIDVLCLGDEASPFEDVSRANLSPAFSIWPNPASQVVHFKNIPLPTDMIIMDALGRIVKKQSLSGTLVVDVSDLPSGLYELYFPSLGITSGFEIFH